MKLNLKAAALSVLAIAPVFLSAGIASAQTQPATRGMEGSYLGGGASVGFSGDAVDNDANVGGHVQGRLDIPDAPVSVRGSALIQDSVALVPTVTFDLGVARNTNLYLGAGYSFVTDEGKTSLLGNQNSVVLNAGVETAVHRNVAIYSDVKVGLDGVENSNRTPVAVQVGAAYRF
ncbi:MAG: porin family protein [Oculatellaceae cyanobacterium Prado106]|jgi:outer membrane autotransporter protein|nr:porin family protein [Oculatellaceae cyanobacterium Prado106]